VKIPREAHLKAVTRLLSTRKVVAILGARQVGKTTLARAIAARRSRVTYFDLEDPRDLARLEEPTLTLEPLRGLVVLDEVQRRPDLFPILRVLADRPRTTARFLVLGSASPELLRQSAETLAGRIAFYELDGFNLTEVGSENAGRLWFRGGFPESYLARTHGASHEWRRDFLRTFVERDIPMLGIGIPAATLTRFWTMLAHYHGQVWNASDLGSSLGVSHTTIRKYLDLLTQTFVIRQLRPWTENIGKRVVKSPKVYLADSGLLHALLQLPTPVDVESHPKLGASWEGFAIEQVLKILGAKADESYFWRTHAGAELDLLIVRGRKRLGFEFKRTDAPRVTPSNHHALNDLKLNRLFIVHAGREAFRLAKSIEAIPLSAAAQSLSPLR
jgi:predicted AAA+ superfamily ATPase